MNPPIPHHGSYPPPQCIPTSGEPHTEDLAQMEQVTDAITAAEAVDEHVETWSHRVDL